MFSSIPANYAEGKNIIKACVRKKDNEEWQASCLMYAKLNDIYLSAQQNISPNVWYKIANRLPQLSSNISHIMSLIMGCQPKGLQHNYELKTCHLCNVERETQSHILFRCQKPQLQNEREIRWRLILSEMPPNMVIHVNSLNEEGKTKFILTCLGGSYVIEWLKIYSLIAQFVTNMYRIRDKLYKEISEQAV